ncbi:Uncharacterised protein [Mycobacterium tuberculosis]|uniref:Uncharacterized protein n=1 Tax=Mycobacterium tuberculosis TaxID=1773 RepID=A0A0T7LCW1_MYCTX|nr:Uncharacterised protein [Mycobacterium tuberculosis]COV67817.1 Uncharacterised protein [Mycobacterium tuberculosis]COW12752.1 Uncharacterised protein [Mycobacterium tuberculosis]
MLDTHVVQQLSPLGTARGGEDLASGGPCDRDRRLPDTTGPRVNQHLVVRADASQIVQGVPSRRGGGRYRGGGHRQLGRERHRQPGIASDECAPAAIGGHAADVITDPMLGDIRPDRGHHTGEVDAQLLSVALEGGIPPESDQNVGEVDTRCGHRDLDLARSRRDPVECDELQRLEVAGSADLQAHTVASVFDDGGSPFGRA